MRRAGLGLRRGLPWLSGGAAALLGAAVLAHAWQIRRVEVTGVRTFDPAVVRQALGEVVGRSPLAASASTLRQRLLRIAWVEDAQVVVALDGTLRCQVRERTPVAVLADEQPPQLVDEKGRLLAQAAELGPWVRLEGFAPYPEERARALALLPEMESLWGSSVRLCRRLALGQLALQFQEEALEVLVSTDQAQNLALARQVLAAWEKAGYPAVARIDARVAGKIYLEPKEARP